jgi:regulator of RNase E activity RraA
VVVEPADIVVADEDGVVVVPSGIGSSTLQAAMQKLTIEATQPFEAWEADHRLRIDKILRDMGFEGRVP